MESPKSGVWWWIEILAAGITLSKLFELEMNSFEQDPNKMINTLMKSFAEKFTWFCGRVHPVLSSKPVRVCHPETIDYFGRWGKVCNLIEILQVLTASHKELHGIFHLNLRCPVAEKYCHWVEKIGAVVGNTKSPQL